MAERDHLGALVIFELLAEKIGSLENKGGKGRLGSFVAPSRSLLTLAFGLGVALPSVWQKRLENASDWAK